MEIHSAANGYAAAMNAYAQAGKPERAGAASSEPPAVAAPARNGDPSPILNMQGQAIGAIVNVEA